MAKDKEPEMVMKVDPNRFAVSPLSSPDAVEVVKSCDGSVEDAVRGYNVGRDKPLTFKQLIVVPFQELVPVVGQ